VVLGPPPGREPGPGALRRGHDLHAASDGDLVERTLDGDQGAFGELVRRHDDRLRGVAFKLLGDRHRMEDAMQDAYVRAYRSLGRFRRDAELSSWLYRIVYNACIDELRRTGRRAVPVDTAEPTFDEPSGRAGPERAVHASDSARRALAALPEDQRATVLLVDGEGLDNVTAAEVLGVAPGTVASRLSRARATMRSVLEGEDR
jgi:RNA polymerase sigma-70 factor (ECF subfamily)